MRRATDKWGGWGLDGPDCGARVVGLRVVKGKAKDGNELEDD